jgi:hypothetical protein
MVAEFKPRVSPLSDLELRLRVAQLFHSKVALQVGRSLLQSIATRRLAVLVGGKARPAELRGHVTS